MDGVARSLMTPFRAVQRPLLFGEGGYMTATRAPDVDSMLQRACSIQSTLRKGPRRIISSAEFAHIAHLISILDQNERRFDRTRWALRPRLYTLLRSLGALAYMDEFVRNGIFDISLPFNSQTLPHFVEDSDLRRLFLDNQDVVLSDARTLESTTDEHLHLDGTADDHLIHYQELGSGGFGAVDIVLSRLSTKFYARKRVFRGRDSEATRREQQYLVEEIRVLKLLSHRHLTRIIQSYSDHKYIGYLMEPIADGNLHRYLVRKHIPETDIVHLRHFFGCLAGAVHYLHSKNIRHRDLKLENVLVKNSQVYVADFGTAMEWSISRRGTTQDRGVPVTQWYMAPEVHDRGPRNNASDMWSLGIVFLEMLTVVKGQTVSMWKDHLKKRALRAKQQPWPCQNLNFIHEWMMILQVYSRRHEGYDDETMALKDNEPLSWIKALLEYKHDDRMSAQSLVMTIADSMYLRDFACFDCVHDLLDPRYRHSGGDHWAGSDHGADRTTIDAEVTAMLGVVNPIEQHVDEEKERTVMAWLEQSREHWADTSRDADAALNLKMPGAFHGGVLPPQAELGMTENGVSSSGGIEEALGRDSNDITAKPLREPASIHHEAGFIIDPDTDSSIDERPDGEVCAPASSEGLFPIVQDASSESSEDALSLSPVDSPMMDIEEEDRLSAIWEEPAEEMQALVPSSRSRKGSNVRFDSRIRAYPPPYVEEDLEEQTTEISRKQRTLTLDRPVLEENTVLPMHLLPAPGGGQAESTPSTQPGHAFHSMVGPIDPIKPAKAHEPSTSLTAPPLDAVLVGKLLEKPTNPKKLPKKKINRPPVKPREPILLPWRDIEPIPTSEPPQENKVDRIDLQRPLVPQIEYTPTCNPTWPLVADAGAHSRDHPVQGHASSTLTDLIISDLVTIPPSMSLPHNNPLGHLLQNGSVDPHKKSSRGKLSTANIDRLNKENKERTKPARREFDDDGFTPASFIEKAWQSAEAADSLATSVMSESTAKKLRGRLVPWNDRTYRYLEFYCKKGHTGAVRQLLDIGCNCGTILKPRPAPLFNAITGGSARHNKCVRALIKSGCDVNVEYRGRRALHAAIEQPFFHGYQKLLAMLLGAGADMNEPDKAGEYPLTKLLKGMGDAPLEEYQRQSLALMLNSKVQSIVNVDVREAFTMETALHLAVRRRSAQAVALLVHRKADVNAKNSSGTTPLLMAANQWTGRLNDQQERILAFLLAAENLDVDATGGTLRRSALHYAAAAGSAIALDRLLDRGADPKLIDKEGNDALAILKNAQRNEGSNEDFQIMLDLLSG